MANASELTLCPIRQISSYEGPQVCAHSFDRLPPEIREIIFGLLTLREAKHPRTSSILSRYRVSCFTVALRSLPLSYNHILNWQYTRDRFLLNIDNAFNIERRPYTGRRHLNYSPRALLSITAIHVVLPGPKNNLRSQNHMYFTPRKLQQSLVKAPNVQSLTIGFNRYYYSPEEHPNCKTLFLLRFPSWPAVVQNIKRFVVRIPCTKPGGKHYEDQRRVLGMIRRHVNKQIGVVARWKLKHQIPFLWDWGIDNAAVLQIWEWEAERGHAMDWKGVTTRGYDAWNLWEANEALELRNGKFLTRVLI